MCCLLALQRAAVVGIVSDSICPSAVLYVYRQSCSKQYPTCNAPLHSQFQDLLLRYNVGDTLPKLQEYSKVRELLGCALRVQVYQHVEKAKNRNGTQQWRRHTPNATIQAVQHWWWILTSASNVDAASLHAT